MDTQSVTIYAPEDVLEGITELPIYIPVNNLTGDQRIPMPINLPSKVTKASVKNVMIDIKVEDAKTKIIKDVVIQYKNAPDAAYDVRAVEGGGTISVKVIGAKGQIDKLTKNDITVIADFSSVTDPGVYNIPLSVSGTNKLVTYELENSTAKLEFKNKE